MKPISKTAILVALAGAVVAAVALKKGRNPAESNGPTQAAASAAISTNAPTNGAKLPKLLDLGAGKCIPCRMMAPILEELKKEYAGRMHVEFIDVWQNPDAGKQYGIELIPTQIFYDAEGNELFRHVGFFGKEDILDKWKELGVDLSGKPAATGATNDPVMAYYFHGTVRCETCLKIERLAREAIEKRFASELAAKQLSFQSVNYDKPENRAYLTKYKLPCPSLVLVRRDDGKDGNWKLLGETWQLVEDLPKFNSYVETEVDKFLRDAK